ncbi:hypothetical protein L218DRAFT_884638 [Marasmius fiardii PR-910]|nr:hypothetical protein L218DRAFT_884638 [Marasmius fiardii PR-910]
MIELVLIQTSEATKGAALQKSWDVLMKAIDTCEDEQVQGYKEDMDTLLVFIAQQSSQSLFTPPSQPPPFTPSASVVRVNTFWFLSLTVALVDALFGLLCKQWLREHKRQTNTQTPRQTLALHWLRYRSFEEWHVPKILKMCLDKERRTN